MHGEKPLRCTCRCTCKASGAGRKKDIPCTSVHPDHGVLKIQPSTVRRNLEDELPQTDRQRLISMMEAQSRQINQELQKLQLEGEITAAAIRAMRCDEWRQQQQQQISMTKPTSAASDSPAPLFYDGNCMIQTYNATQNSTYPIVRSRQSNQNMNDIGQSSATTVEERLGNLRIDTKQRSGGQSQQTICAELLNLRAQQASLADRIQSLQRARNALLHNLSELLASQTRETISLPREKKNPDLLPPAPRQDYEYLSGVQDIGEQADRVLHAVQPPDQVLKKNSTSNHGHAVSPITATSTIMPPKKLQSKQVSHTDCECQTDAVPEDIYATLASVRSYNVQFPPYLPKPSSANPIGKNTQASDLGKGPASVSALAAVAAIAATSFITKALNYQEPKSEGVGLSIKPGACQTGLPTFQPLQYSQNVKNQDQNKHILAVQTSPQSQNPQPPKSISDVPSGNSANTPYLYSYQYDHSPPPPPAPVASALNPSGQRYNYLNEFNLPNFQVDQPFSYGDEVNLPCPTHLSTNRPPCIEVGNQDVLRLTDDGLSSKEPSTLAALSEPLLGCRSAITSPNVLRRTMFSERILQAKRAVDDGLFTRRQSRDQPVGLEPQTAMRCRKERGSNGKMMSHSLHGSLELEHLLSPPAYRRNTVPEFLTHSRLSGPAHSSGPYDRLSGINFQSPFGTAEVLNSQHRQMPVQIVKPAMRKSAALDSSGLDTGSPSDSTTSNASDTLFATENTKRNQSRERRPKSALISESNRLRRYRKADKRNGTHRTVVWIDELYDSPNFLEEKRDSANDTQESSSTRSNSQSLSCPERRCDTESTVCTNNTEVPSKFKERGFSEFDEHYSSSCINVRPTDIGKYSQIAAEGALTEEGSEGSSKYHRSLPDPKIVSFGRSQK